MTCQLFFKLFESLDTGYRCDCSLSGHTQLSINLTSLGTCTERKSLNLTRKSLSEVLGSVADTLLSIIALANANFSRCLS